jgi:hypothetical protein
MCPGAAHSSPKHCRMLACGGLGQPTDLQIKASGAKCTLSWLTQREANVGPLSTRPMAHSPSPESKAGTCPAGWAATSPVERLSQGALRTSIRQVFQQSSHVNVHAHKAGHGLTEELLTNARHQQRLAGGGSASVNCLEGGT